MARVLVVDDAKDVLLFVEQVLQSAGHEVVPCEDALDLEVRLEEQRPQLLLLDIVLPERNGYQVLRSLRRSDATKQLPVVLISSKKEETDIEWGMMQGADGYLTKPFSADSLLEVVERFQ